LTVEPKTTASPATAYGKKREVAKAV